MKSISVSKLMKTLDFFSQPFSFKINNQKKIKSFLGGIFTLHLIGILFFFAYMFGNDIFFKKKPIVLMQNEVLTYSPFVNFTKDNSIFSLRLEDDNGFPIKNYSNFISILISVDVYVPVDGGFRIVSTPLNFSKCDKNLNLGFLLNKSHIDEYLCIINYNMNIGGFWGMSEFISYLNIQVFGCQNSTENNNSCVNFGPDQKLFFNLYFSDGNVNLLNIENPIEYKLTNIYTLLDHNFYKMTYLKYSNLEVNTDTGFLLKSNSNSSSFFLDNINSDLSLRNKNPLAQYNVFLTNKKQTISRSYIKLQDIGAQLGGITQILIIIFTLLITPFQEKLLNEKLMNQLFRYSKHELGTKKQSISDFTQIERVMKISKKRILNTDPIKTGSRMNFDLIESRISLKDKIKEEKIDFIVEGIKNSKRFQFTKCERIISVYLCKCIHSKKIITKDILVDKSILHLDKFLNVNVLFEKIMEFDILKFLLFNKEQMMVFNFLEKPEIYINETKINSNFSKMMEKLKVVNRESAFEIIQYFLKFSKQELKISNSIDAKLFGILEENLRDLICSLK